jgi:FkbM family methyltransferase
MKPDTIGTGETKLCFLKLIPKNSTILCAGIGANISPEIDLINQKECLVVALDPSYLTKGFLSRTAHIPNFMWLPYALNSTEDSLMFYESIDGDLMGSPDKTHSCITKNKSTSYLVKSLTLDYLINLISNISYLKIDIEGGEYGVLQNLKELNIPQVSIEFHHFASDTFSEEDTKDCLDLFEGFGYKSFDYGDGCEFLFVKKDLI